MCDKQCHDAAHAMSKNALDPRMGDKSFNIITFLGERIFSRVRTEPATSPIWNVYREGVRQLLRERHEMLPGIQAPMQQKQGRPLSNLTVADHNAVSRNH